MLVAKRSTPPTARFGAAFARLGDALVVAGGQDAELNVLCSAELLTAGKWHPLPDMPVACSGARGVELGGKLYVVGGADGNDVRHSTVSIFDPETMCWAEGPPMLEARSLAAVAAVGADIYAVGGYDDSDRCLRSAERLRDGEWHALPPMPVARVGNRARGRDEGR